MSNRLLRIAVFTLGLALLATSLLACAPIQPADLAGAPGAATTKETTTVPQSDDKQRPAGWREESHSNDADPNYDVVFPIDAVSVITITIAPENWAAMQADMEELYGADRDLSLIHI